jgi:hypothetical protein
MVWSWQHVLRQANSRTVDHDWQGFLVAVAIVVEILLLVVRLRIVVIITTLLLDRSLVFGLPLENRAVGLSMFRLYGTEALACHAEVLYF